MQLPAPKHYLSFKSILTWGFTALLSWSCMPEATASAQQNTTPVSGDEVKAEFLHAFHAYQKYAWGHDGVKPLSKTPFDWYAEPLLLTPIDALDTMLIMGLTTEAEQVKELIFERLPNFDKDIEIQHFEIAIRLLGGLISSYQLDGDKRLLTLAIDLANRLLPIFDSPTGMPYRLINLHTGRRSGSQTNPAEIGTYLLEYGTLSTLTGDQRYYAKAKQAMQALYARRSTHDLVGSGIDVESGAWFDRTSTIGGGGDSYYEYMIKGWLLFGDTDMKQMWETSIAAINSNMADELPNGLWYGRADMTTGKRTAARYGALDAFFPTLLALSGDLGRAERLANSSYQMWMLHGIEPEQLDYQTMTVTDSVYLLRPEIIESAYYLHHFTNDAKYRQMGFQFFHDVVKYCRTDEAYAALQDVRTKQQSDMMESFFFAETLKYFYLLFTDNPRINLDRVVFSTEAHPMAKPAVSVSAP